MSPGNWLRPICQISPARAPNRWACCWGYTLGGDDARFVAGLTEALAAYDTPLLGGDTIAVAGPRTFGLTAIGRATHRPVPSRSGALVGDRL